MKNTFKIALAGLAILSIVYVGCKKTDLQTKNDSTKNLIDQKEVAEKMALAVYQSLSEQIVADYLKTSGNNGLKMAFFNGYSKCGDFEFTPTNKTVVNGDTTTKYFGNSKFTLMCDGSLWGEGAKNAYLLDDTLKTTVFAPRIKNTYDNILNFHVKALDGISFSTEGTAQAKAKFLTLDAQGAEEEQHTFSTKYTFNKIVGQRILVNEKVKGKFVFGTVDFEYISNYTYAKQPEKNSSSTNAGIMFFKPDNTMDAYFKIEGSPGYYKYTINLSTGEVSDAKKVDYIL